MAHYPFSGNPVFRLVRQLSFPGLQLFHSFPCLDLALTRVFTAEKGPLPARCTCEGYRLHRLCDKRDLSHLVLSLSGNPWYPKGDRSWSDPGPSSAIMAITSLLSSPSPLPCRICLSPSAQARSFCPLDTDTPPGPGGVSFCLLCVGSRSSVAASRYRPAMPSTISRQAAMLLSKSIPITLVPLRFTGLYVPSIGMVNDPI